MHVKQVIRFFHKAQTFRINNEPSCSCLGQLWTNPSGVVLNIGYALPDYGVRQPVRLPYGLPRTQPDVMNTYIDHFRKLLDTSQDCVAVLLQKLGLFFNPFWPALGLRAPCIMRLSTVHSQSGVFPIVMRQVE